MYRIITIAQNQKSVVFCVGNLAEESVGAAGVRAVKCNPHLSRGKKKD